MVPDRILLSSPMKLNIPLFLRVSCSWPVISFSRSLDLSNLNNLSCVSFPKCTQAVQSAITLALHYPSTWSTYALKLCYYPAPLRLHTPLFSIRRYIVTPSPCPENIYLAIHSIFLRHNPRLGGLLLPQVSWVVAMSPSNQNDAEIPFFSAVDKKVEVRTRSFPSTWQYIINMYNSTYCFRSTITFIFSKHPFA